MAMYHPVVAGATAGTVHLSDEPHALETVPRVCVDTCVDACESPLLQLDDASPKNRRRGRCALLQEYALRPHVSLFWVEKVVMIIQYAQLWGLFWAFARPWPFPFVLRNQTRWVVWLNLDIPSALTYIEDNNVVPALRGSTYGTYTNYWAVSVAWAAVPGVVALAYWLLLRYAWLRYWDMRAIRIWAQDCILMFAHLIYLPALLALSRTYVCETHPLYEGFRLAVDPELECFQYQHFILAIACLPSTLLIWLGVPALMIWRIHEQLVYARQYEHERFVRWKEAEYVHGLSFDWRRGHFWLFSSFRRTALHVYDRPLWMLSMSILVLVFCYSRRSPSVMADVLFAVVVIWQVRQVIYPAYRCGTSNALALSIYTGMSIIVFWGVMRAHGMTNQFTVDSAFTLAQRGMNAGLLAAIVLVLAVSCAPAFGWPKGYIGPHLWRKLLAEEQADESRDRGFDDMELPGAERASSQGRSRRRSGVLHAFSRRLRALSGRFGGRSRGPLAAQARRDDPGSALPSATPSLAVEAQDPGLPNSGLQTASPAVNRVFFAATPAAQVATARRVPNAWATPHDPVPKEREPAARGGADAAAVESGAAVTNEMDAHDQRFRDLEMAQSALLAGDAGGGAVDDAASAFDIPAMTARRASEAPDVNSKDFESLLEAREREYELREYFGEDVADELLLQQKRNEFAWQGLQEEDVETGFGAARNATLQRKPTSAQHAVRFHSGVAPFADVVPSSAPGQGDMSAPGTARSGRTASRFRRHVANAGTLQVLRPADSLEDSSSIDSSAQARSLTPAEVSALEAVWVVTVRNARAALRANAFVPAEIVNVPLLRRWVQLLRREYRRAHRCRHVLAWSLEETLDDVSALADACQSRTLFPNPLLEALLRDLKTRLDRREREYALTSTKRRHIITKLFALAALMNGRRIARLHIPGVNDKFFLQQALANGDTGSTESEDFSDSLGAYAHITSIFRDVLPLEISMMGVKDLKEIVTDVLSQRLVVDVLRQAKRNDWHLPREALSLKRSASHAAAASSRRLGVPGPADAGGTGATAAGDVNDSAGPLQADVSLLDYPDYDFPADGLPEDTHEMLLAVYDRAHELMLSMKPDAMSADTGAEHPGDGTARSASAGEPSAADLLLVVEPWVRRFAPNDARDRGLLPWQAAPRASSMPRAGPGSRAAAELGASLMQLRLPSPTDSDSSELSSATRFSSRAHEVTGSMLYDHDRRLIGSAMTNLRPNTAMSSVSTVRPYSAATARPGNVGVADASLRVDIQRGRPYASERNVLSPINESVSGSPSRRAGSLHLQPTGSSRGFGAAPAPALSSRTSGRWHAGEDESVEKWDEEDITVHAPSTPSSRTGSRATGSAASVVSASQTRQMPMIPELRLRPVFEEARRESTGGQDAE